MPVPLVDLRAQYLTIEDQIQSQISGVLQKMNLYLGENVSGLEQEFADYCGVRHAVGLGSGTDALLMALRALNIRRGDEVITVSHTFVATAEAIVLAGAHPVFVDIDPETYTLDPDQVESAINHRTRAIIPVHLYGHPVDMEPILDIAASRGLRVIEDAAQAHGAGYHALPVGSLGDAACFSFYYSKNLGAYGEAGMLVTNDGEIATAVRSLRDHGSEAKYTHKAVGYNSRLDEIQAAILRVKLPFLEDWNDSRRELAQMYNERLKSLPIILPIEQVWARHVYHLYVVRTALRDPLYEWLHSRGIGAGIHYPTPVHQQHPYRHHRSHPANLPVTEQLAREVLSLPMYPELECAQMDEVVGAIYDFFASHLGKSSANGHLSHVRAGTDTSST